MSNIRINYISYRVVPIIKNGNTPTLENNPYIVEPVSAINTNLGYNSNNPNNGEYSTKINNIKNSSFEDILQEEMAKVNSLGHKK